MIVGLLPARTGTGWWHSTVACHADIFFLRGRIKFVRGSSQQAAPFDSALVVWAATKGVVTQLKEAFPTAHYVPASKGKDKGRT